MEIAVESWAVLETRTLERACIRRPRSFVGVTSRDGLFPAIVIIPTALSGLASVLAVNTVWTASAWAWKRVGG